MQYFHVTFPQCFDFQHLSQENLWTIRHLDVKTKNLSLSGIKLIGWGKNEIV